MVLKGQATKKKLLSEDRTSEQALKVVQADELAEKESKQLQFNFNVSAKVQASPAHPVNKQQSATTGKTHGNFVFVVDPHNIWLISATTAHLFVISVRRDV